jgi:large subunit ribosomal protein L23Ae
VKASPVKTPFAAKPGSSLQPSVTSCHVSTLRGGRNARHFRISAQHIPRLGPYEVLKYPVFTEATVRDAERQNTLVIIVDVRADKSEIKAAVQDILGVKVEKVNTLIRSASAWLVIPSCVLQPKPSNLN